MYVRVDLSRFTEASFAVSGHSLFATYYLLFGTYYLLLTNYCRFAEASFALSGAAPQPTIECKKTQGSIPLGEIVGRSNGSPFGAAVSSK